MKKKILAVAITLAALAGIPAVAQNNADNNTPKKECCKEKKECCKEKCDKDKKCDKGQKPGKCNKQCKQMNPFEGLALTDAQKAQLDQLREKRMAERQAKAEARKAGKQNRDSAKVADRKACAKTYLDEVKAILTPEQYTQFLENMYVNGGQRHGDKAKACKQGKPGKPGQKANRPQGAPDGKPGKAPKSQKNG